MSVSRLYKGNACLYCINSGLHLFVKETDQDDKYAVISIDRRLALHCPCLELCWSELPISNVRSLYSIGLLNYL